MDRARPARETVIIMQWLDLAFVMAVTASTSCGIVYGLAMAQNRIRLLHHERNAALMKVSSQAATIDRLLQRQQCRHKAQDISGNAGR